MFTKTPVLLKPLFLVVVLSLIGSPNDLLADVTGYSDGWTYDDTQAEWEGFYTTEIFGFGVSESDYGEFVAVDTIFIDPYENLYAWGGWQQGTGFSRSDTAATVDVDTAPDGEWRVESDHYGESGWLFYTILGIGSTFYFSRYYYNHSYFDSQGRMHWVFLPYNCSNRCTATHRDYLAWREIPPAFISAAGKRWSVFGFGWCQMKDREVPEQWTRCSPAY